MRAQLQAARAWVTARWRGPIPTLGMAGVAFELGAKLLLGRVIDPEVIPVALALILWEPQRQKQRRRNHHRRERGGE
jgi:hypothetical protein